jgi:acetyltransferase-like isoleucine patch superfamily enzyme
MTVVGGNPARVIRRRFATPEEEERHRNYLDSIKQTSHDANPD